VSCCNLLPPFPIHVDTFISGLIQEKDRNKKKGAGIRENSGLIHL